MVCNYYSGVRGPREHCLTYGMGYAYCLFLNINGGLVGWVSAQEPSFSLRKSIRTTDRFVVQNLCHLFFGGEKQRREKYASDCVKLTQENKQRRRLCCIQYHYVRCDIRHARQYRDTG